MLGGIDDPHSTLFLKYFFSRRRYMQEKERSASALPTGRVTNSKQRLDVGETVLNGSEVALEQPSRVFLWFL